MNLNELNERQIQAVTTKSKRCLIIAGAGTGKTKTIVSRILYLIEQGILPENILGLTFSNKAAGEMSSRINSQLSDKTIAIKTFHSFGVKILRQYGNLTDRGCNFVIYDDDDTKKVITKIAKAFDANSFVKDIRQNISLYKQNLLKLKIDRPYDFQAIFEQYQQTLRQAKAYDFDDLLLEPIMLLQNNADIRKKITNRYKFILVDEYQDTNQTQFALLNQLLAEESSIMVVGDEDQSIYKFRGADIHNILNFKDQFENVEIIKLQENYRSTSQILNVANSVIANNTKRLGKTLTTKSEGSKPIFMDFISDKDEANAIIETIIKEKLDPCNTAIIYRTNAMSQKIEQALLAHKLKFTVYGSVALFDKEEIKDTLAIIKWLLNPNDKISFERFVNKPPRGIGDKTLASLYNYAETNNLDLFDAIQNVAKSCDNKLAKIFDPLATAFSTDRHEITTGNLTENIGYIFDALDLTFYYKQFDDAETRISNVRELLTTLSDTNGSIQDILDEIALEPSAKTRDDGQTLKLMTVHNAKGLEFDNVFLYGLNENLFPHINAVQSGDEDGIEEERRLCYVGITRARKRLYMSCSTNRFSFEGYTKYRRSRFIDEIDPQLLEIKHFTMPNPQEKNVHSDDRFNIEVGCLVRHKNYGAGKVIEIIPKNGKHLVMIDFFDFGQAQFILEYTKLEIVE